MSAYSLIVIFGQTNMSQNYLATVGLIPFASFLVCNTVVTVSPANAVVHLTLFLHAPVICQECISSYPVSDSMTAILTTVYILTQAMNSVMGRNRSKQRMINSC